MKSYEGKCMKFQHVFLVCETSVILKFVKEQ